MNPLFYVQGLLNRNAYASNAFVTENRDEWWLIVPLFYVQYILNRIAHASNVFVAY